MPSPGHKEEGRRIAVFLDRDGTLIHDPGYLHEPEKVALLDGVAETLERMLRAGVLVFLFTNQSGPARGLFPMSDVVACNRRMLDLIGLGDFFAGVCIADEPPGSAGGYRKPSPRFILETVAKFSLDPRMCWAVGDKRRDLESAAAAGIRAIRMAADIDDPSAAAYATERSIPAAKAFKDILDFIKPEE